MSAYVIDFSDPLKNGFSIPAGGFNGPGGSNANTTLRLYGRGALEWGEAVNEDLVRLAENFASASPPSVATAGQLWAEVTYYYHDTTQTATTGWYYYDINSVAANKWTLLNGTGIVSTVVPVTPVVGQYYLDTAPAPDVLYGYYSLGRYEPATFVARSYTTGAGAPTAGTFPRTTLRVRDSAAGAWVSPSTTTASPTASPPTNPQQGQLWYDTTTGNLNVWTGTVWQEILGPTGASLSIASGNLDMGGFRITNMADPVAAQDAATRAYVLAVVGGVSGFLPTSGGTLSGPGNLVVSGTLTVNGVATFNSTAVHNANSTFTTLSSSGLASLNSVSTAGAIASGSTLTAGTSLSVGTTATINGQLNMTGQRIINVGTPISGPDAATKAYVDAAVSGGGGTTPVIWSSGTFKAGDITIQAGKIYIANAAGSGFPNAAWKQVFPAVYA